MGVEFVGWRTRRGLQDAVGGSVTGIEFCVLTVRS